MSVLPTGPAVPGWSPRERLTATALHGRLVTVQPLSLAAADGLWEALGGAETGTWTYMGYGPFSERAEMDSLLASWVNSRDPIFYTFDLDGSPAGWGAYLRIDPASGSVEVGHLVFGPSLARTAAATEVMYLMARHAFDAGYRRYEWKCDALNARSRAAAERLGFTYEGTFRQHMVYKGRNRDTAWFSMLDGEWPAIRRRLEAWLEPSNFDASGHQRVGLNALVRP